MFPMSKRIRKCLVDYNRYYNVMIILMILLFSRLIIFFIIKNNYSLLIAIFKNDEWLFISKMIVITTIMYFGCDDHSTNIKFL